MSHFKENIICRVSYLFSGIIPHSFHYILISMKAETIFLFVYHGIAKTKQNAWIVILRKTLISWINYILLFFIFLFNIWLLTFMPPKQSMGLYSNMTKKTFFFELVINESFKLIYVAAIKIKYTKNV